MASTTTTVFQPTTTPLLRTQSLTSGYGNRQVLNGVSVELRQGEIVAVIGHNGAGKSTLLKTIFGLVPTWSGQVEVDGGPVPTPTPEGMLHRGIRYLPQGNRVYASLTVRENLEMGGCILPNRAAVNAGVERVIGLFPLLRTRLKQRAGTLSGGERQMVTLASAFMLCPRILLLDEPSLGLSPKIVSEVLKHIAAIVRESGVSVLIVEQKVREVLGIANRVCVMRLGQVSFTGQASELNNAVKLKEVYL